MMGAGIHAARQTRGDDEARRRQITHHTLGEGQPGRRGVARADDGHHGAGENRDIAQHREQGRRGVDGAQGLGILGLPKRDKPRADGGQPLHFALAGVEVGQHQRAPLLGRHARGCVQSGSRAAKAIDEAAEGLRTDAVRANEAKPIETLCVRQTRARSSRFAHVCWPILLSEPARRRAILARWVKKIMAASTTARSPCGPCPVAKKAKGASALATRAASEE